MNIYTIGFTKKSAEAFFESLHINQIETVLDIRLNNTSQLSGFAKGIDLQYFLAKINGIRYVHDTHFAPTDELLNDYKNKKITWNDYESIFNQLLLERNIKDYINSNYMNMNNYCLLCSEDIAEKCHRRLVAEYIKNNVFENVSITHL